MEMSGQDIDKVLTALEKPSVQQGVQQATSFAQQAEQTLKAAEGALDIVDRAVKVMERTGSLPALIRIMSAKFGVDPDKPLATAEGILPASDAHKAVIQAVNRMSPQELQRLSEAYSQMIQAQKQERISDGAEGKVQTQPRASSP